MATNKPLKKYVIPSKYRNVDWRQINPPKYLPAESIEALAAVGCNYTTAARALGVHPVTLRRDLDTIEGLRDAWERGKARGEVGLRVLSWNHAHMPNSAGVAMTVHLRKHMLGEHDKSEHKHEVSLLGKMLDEIDGNTRSLPNPNQQMIDVTPGEPTGGNAILDAVVKRKEPA